MSENEKGTSSEERPQRLSDEKPEGTDEVLGKPEVDPTLALKAEAEKYKRDYLYLLAEFDNYKRNNIKERSDLRKYGAERLAVDLLNVLDIFDSALATEVTPENLANFRKGIEMTAQELRATLGRHGIEEIPSYGKPFDPSVHEALSSEETNDVPNGHISRVFKKPFKLHDRVIRPGQVVVAKPKS
jgi:molecular chaperone GrpE